MYAVVPLSPLGSRAAAARTAARTPARRGPGGGEEGSRPGSSPRTGALGPLHDERGDLDLARCESGRPDARLRPPGRPLPDAHHGRRGDAAHERPAARHAAALQSGRVADRLRLGPQRRRERVAHGRRGRRADAAQQGDRERLPLAGVDAGRQVRRRLALAGVLRPGEALALSRGRRHRPRDGRRERGAAHAGRGGGRRGALHLVRATPRHLAVQRDLPAVPALGLRPADRNPDADDEPVRLRVPPRPLARRGMARLRHPRGHRDGDPAARTRLGRGTVARLPGAAGRPGIDGHHGRAAGLLVHARLGGDRRLLRGRDLARARRRERAGRDPVHGQRGGRGRPGS